MEDVIIRQIPIGPLEVMTYIVACPQTREAVVIDPAGEADMIAGIVQEEGSRIKYILNTHGHADHVVANRRLKEILSVPTCMHELDDRFFFKKDVREKCEQELGLPPPDAVDLRLKAG